MYLAGYSIECKLKARLMEMYSLDTLHQLEAELEHRFGRPVDVFTHSIEFLFKLTGALDRLLDDSRKSTTALRAYQRCNAWKPAWRYKSDDGSKDECEYFMDAVEKFGRFIDCNI